MQPHSPGHRDPAIYRRPAEVQEISFPVWLFPVGRRVTPVQLLRAARLPNGNPDRPVQPCDDLHVALPFAGKRAVHCRSRGDEAHLALYNLIVDGAASSAGRVQISK